MKNTRVETINLVDVMKDPKKDLRQNDISIKEVGYGVFLSRSRLKKLKELKEGKKES